MQGGHHSTWTRSSEGFIFRLELSRLKLISLSYKKLLSQENVAVLTLEVKELNNCDDRIKL